MPDIKNAEGNEGYKLFGTLNTSWLGKQMFYEPVVDSTNKWAKRRAEEGAGHGCVYVTKNQTAGKGRMGRVWESPEGNLYFSVLLRPEFSVSKASMVTLISAMAMTKAIEDITGMVVSIKWPNDIVVNGKKLCGILTESSTRQKELRYLVVGIGVNVNQRDFSGELADKATSLFAEVGYEVDAGELIGHFLNRLEKLYENLAEVGDLRNLAERYNERLINKGREVRIIEGEQERIQKAIGIDNFGGLIVENENGVRETIISGEVSVRGIYGYV